MGFSVALEMKSCRKWIRNSRNLSRITNFGINLDKKNQLDVIFVFFISLLIVSQHVSGNHVPIIRS